MKYMWLLGFLMILLLIFSTKACECNEYIETFAAEKEYLDEKIKTTYNRIVNGDTCLLTNSIKRDGYECENISRDSNHKKMCNACMECEWYGGKCNRKNSEQTPYDVNSNLDSNQTVEKTDEVCKEQARSHNTGWQTESKCTNGCKWCTKKDNGDSICVSTNSNEDCDDKPNTLDNPGYYGDPDPRFDSSPKDIPENGICYLDSPLTYNNSTVSDKNQGYKKYGCKLGSAYQKCLSCADNNKCFGLIAGGGFGCVGCTGDNASKDSASLKKVCLQPPLDGVGCPDGTTIPRDSYAYGRVC